MFEIFHKNNVQKNYKAGTNSHIFAQFTIF